MKIGIEEIKKIVSDGKTMGYSLRTADIFYIFAVQIFNEKILYEQLFGGGSEEEITSYNSSDKIKFLKKYINSNYPSIYSGKNEQPNRVRQKKTSTEHEDITFEENKAYMLKLKKETEEAIINGEIEKKDGLKILADLSVKLNDKFAVSEKQDEQRIVVLSKYNDTCPYCRHEIRRKTDEDMIAEIKEKYILTPKQAFKDNGDE